MRFRKVLKEKHRKKTRSEITQNDFSLTQKSLPKLRNLFLSSSFFSIFKIIFFWNSEVDGLNVRRELIGKRFFIASTHCFKSLLINNYRLKRQTSWWWLWGLKKKLHLLHVVISSWSTFFSWNAIETIESLSFLQSFSHTRASRAVSRQYTLGEFDYMERTKVLKKKGKNWGGITIKSLFL